MRRQNTSEKKMKQDRRRTIGTYIRKKVGRMKGKRRRKQREVHVEEDERREDNNR